MSIRDTARGVFERCLAAGTMYDVAVCCMQLLDCEWSRSACRARDVWAMVHDVVRYPPLQWLLDERFIDVCLAPKLRFSGLARFHREEYLKLARLVQHMQTTVAFPTTPATVLGVMEEFSQSLGRWLKVASGVKSTCLESAAISSTGRSPAGLLVEFGAFVGYSAVTVARRVPQVRMLSCEIDAVHVAIAKFVASMALPAADIQFCVGRAADVVRFIVEDSGAHAVQFVFMDHSNSHFHEEFATLERLSVGSATTCVLADNVLKPGAPLFSWMTWWSPAANTTWAMCEFRHDDQEDWMVTAGMVAPAQFSPIAIFSPDDFGKTDEDPFSWRWSWGVRHRKD